MAGMAVSTVTREYDLDDRAAASKARAALSAFEPALSRRTFQDARLLVTELITNALRHAPAARDGRVALRLTLGAGGLRIEVSDPGHGFEPQIEGASPDGGRGLLIVHQLSDRWGIRASPTTTVWCMLTGA
jgi:anti-sigma regulatory factor (Ser/Thr protein kinase)